MDANSFPRGRRTLIATVGAAILTLSACGGDDESGTSATSETGSAGENAARYEPPKRDVAIVIDTLQGHARSGDVEAICDELFTEKLAGTIASRNDTTCGEQVKAKLAREDARFEIGSIKIRGDKAVAKVTDFTGATNGMYFVDQEGWKIDSIYDLEG